MYYLPNATVMKFIVYSVIDIFWTNMYYLHNATVMRFIVYGVIDIFWTNMYCTLPL